MPELERMLAQPVERPRQPRLHGPPRAAQGGRRLLLGQVEEVAAGDRLAVVLGQSGHRRQQLVAPLEVEERRLRRRDRATRAALLGHAQDESLAAARGAHAVARLVCDDREQPRPQRRALAKAAESAVRLDESVLGRLLGVGRGARDYPRSPEGDVLMPPHDLLIGVALATLRPRDELRFVWWPVLHRARTTTPGPDRFR